MTETGEGLPGVTMSVGESTGTVTTDEEGNYSFPDLLEGNDYSVIPTMADFAFTPTSKNFVDLSADQTANFVAKPLPQILTVEGTDVALALESVTFMAQPFSVLSDFEFGVDGITRVMVFASNLEVNDVSQVSAAVEDGSGNTYPVPIEYLGYVLGQGWLKQLNIKLAHNIPSGTELKLRISIAEGSSNPARLRIAALGQ